MLLATWAGIFLICVSVSHAVNVTEKDVIDRLLQGYDPTVLPSAISGKPTTVKVNFFLKDMYALDNSMRYVGAQLTFRQQWKDPRLAYLQEQELFRYLSVKDSKKLWVPDVFFSNSRKGRFNDIMEPNSLIRIFPDGEVLYSRRVTLDLRCHTKRQNFPLNQIVCSVVIASYGFTTEDLVLDWKAEGPVQVSKNVDLPPYAVSLGGTTFCTSRTNTGEYSCLIAEFVLERDIGSAFYVLYLPTLVLVLLGWLSFFLHGRAHKVRLSLTLVLVVLGWFCCAHSLWLDPNPLTLTASDAWNGLCLLFIIYTLLHCLMTRSVPCLAKVCGYEHKSRHNDVSMQPIMEGDSVGLEGGKEKSKMQFSPARLRHLVTKSGNRADIVARILYPSAFIVANIVYWAVYSQGYDKL